MEMVSKCFCSAEKYTDFMVNWRIYQEKTFIERQYNTGPQTSQDHILPIVSLNISYVCSNRYAWQIQNTN